MFIPKDRASVLQLPKHDKESPEADVRSIVANRDRRLIAVATNDAIYIWLANTNQNKIFIYSLELREDEQCYNFTDPADPYFQRNSPELFLKGSRPVAHLHPTIIINLADVPTSCVPSRDEFIVCLRNGFTHHVTWTGEIIASLSFRLNSIPFSVDQLQSKSENVASKSTYIVETVYAPLLGGFAIVLSDGTAALLTSNDPNFAPNAILGVWAPNLKDATCCDVNHKFLLILFGCKNGDVCAYNIDELNGSLVQSFRVAPKVTNGPDITNRLGPVYKITALMSGYGFAAVWAPKKKEDPNSEVHPLPSLLAVFTPFGAQSFCNLEGVVEDFISPENSENMYTAVEWGPEGYQLWLGTSRELRMQSFIRTASCSSPIMEHCDRAVLMSDSQVLISAARDREADACAPHSVWDHITVTLEYLSSNWPLRYASTDRNYNHLVVAGNQGIAYCALTTRRWKIFGNETQEKNLLVTGGVFIWNDDVIGVVGLNADTDKPHLSFYPISQRLDNRFASVIDLENKAVMSALRDDVCAVFDVSAQITLYKLTAHLESGRDAFTKVSGDIVTVIRINEIVPHPTCIVSLQMTQLNMDVRGKLSPAFYSSIDTVIVNIAGRLITLSLNEDGKLHQPMVIASYVEKMWHDRCFVSQNAVSQTLEALWNGHRRNGSNVSVQSVSTSSEPPSPLTQSSSSHLSNALWIACGEKGIKVWMPLVPGKRTTTSQDMTFIAKRIMLPFELDIYPIVISARDCLAIGVESQLQHVARTSRSHAESISMYSLHRNSEVFVHHLLRQLLKRNLGVFALELAGACRSLPHFSHALELLLHGVLEEEATSSEPIPDPLLPRCVAFIHEFPEFLKTVAHCARKTELALWRALFDVTGSPNALFEECLQLKQLENAASFVIVLQNLETTEVSMEQAARLVREALAEKKWTIAKEMVRFASSIGQEDIDALTPPPSAKTSLSRRPTASSPNSETSSNEFVINRFQAGAGRLSKVRHSQSSTDQKDSRRKDSVGSKDKTALSRGLSGELSPPLVVNQLAAKMTTILEEHAWYLLNNYWLLDLGFFWSELQFNLPGLLELRRKQVSLSPKSTNDNCYLIGDFALALTRLHAQFAWPYPVIGSHFVHQVEKKLGNIRVSQSTASLNGLIAAESTDTLKPKARKTEKTTIDLNGAHPIRETDNENSEEDVEIQEAILERIQGNRAEIEPTLDRSTSTSSPMNPSSTTHAPASPSSCDSRSLADDWQNTDFLVGAKSSRGNIDSSRQIDLLLSLFSQTATIDWIFLLCLISRDERRLRQEINVAMVRRVGEKSFARIRFACSELARWAVEKCCGYVALLQAFDAHLTVVAEQAGVSDVKFVPNGKERKSCDEPKKEERGRRTNGGIATKLNGSFTKPMNGERRQRSRSADRAHRSMKRYG
uniref:Protein RIC1 homolog n=1 Tax=Caenorhabditis japonica TaxID=281687 RepID=A0A8R1HRZ4_CAEJA